METKTKTKAVTIKGYQLSSPNQMGAMSKVLQDYIKKQNLSVNIVGKEYAMVEGWQFAGGLLGIFPKVKRVENLSTGQEKKWLAEVELINREEKVVGVGIAICSNAENKKRTFDEYAVLSMAQTRAIGKAYRNLIGWVMKLAGYEATPQEEMVKVGGENVVAAKQRQDQNVDQLFLAAKDAVEKETDKKRLSAMLKRVDERADFTLAQQVQLKRAINTKLNGTKTGQN